MNLSDLLTRHAWRAPLGVPDWMIGWFKRYSISFADGLTDVYTHVCWLQSRNFTIDLRLPRRAEQAPPSQGEALRRQDLLAIDPDTWRRWADFEGWKAPSTWDGQRLSWHTPDASLQWHDRWPEPAILHRVGQCMVEFCDSGAYVEDWRLQPSAPGPLVGLHLLCERDADTGLIRHLGGGWIVCGDHAALVLGRPGTCPRPQPGRMLRDHVAALCNQGPEAHAELGALFDFEASVASWDGVAHRVQWSTRPERVGEVLCPTEGFTWCGHPTDSAPPEIPVPPHLKGLPLVSQELKIEGRPVIRHFAVDTLEPELGYGLTTPCSAGSQAWLEREGQTLRRYTAVLADAHPDRIDP